jgi:cytochrome b
VTSDAELSMQEPALVRVWDVPVRSVHWLVALLVLVSWITAENGWLRWHRLSGYAVLSLVGFRIYWGFCGSRTARFADFVRGPGAAVKYLRTFSTRRDPAPSAIGHNPLGGWNVVALLALLFAQALLGLFAVDVDGLESGPLARHVSFETGRYLAALHHVLFNVLLVLIGLHVLAVLLHGIYRRENLIGPMITGFKRVPGPSARWEAPPAAWRAWIGLAASFGLVMILAEWI